MNDLLLLQQKFQDFLLTDNLEISQEVVSTSKVPASVRLNIYGNGYRTRLIEALEATYPVLKKILGEETFNTLGNAYLDKFPSHFRSIRWFGDQLSDFLTDYPELKSHSHLSELARIEWTMSLVFDSADSNIVTVESMGAFAPEDWPYLQFTAHPSVRLVHLNWNVIQIWQDVSAENKASMPIRTESPVAWVFWRKDLINQFSSLETDEAYALQALLKGLNFGEICEGLCDYLPEEEVAIRAASILKSWILSGIIAEIRI